MTPNNGSEGASKHGKTPSGSSLVPDGVMTSKRPALVRRQTPKSPGASSTAASQSEGPKSPSKHESKALMRRSNPFFVNIPKPPTSTDMAFMAMRYLPTPLLVLSSLKTVVLANEAMGRLLGMELATASKMIMSTEEEPDVTKMLYGKTLGQVGVDMMQDGSPIWVSWERFLDGLANEAVRQSERPTNLTRTESERTVTSSGLTPTPTGHVHTPLDEPVPTGPGTPEYMMALKRQEFVQDVVVNVGINPSVLNAPESSNSPQITGADETIHAKMIISIWTMDHQRFYSLTFTSPTSIVAGNPKTSRAPISVGYSNPPPASPSSASSDNTSGSSSYYFFVPPEAQPSPFLPSAAPARTSLAATPSIVQKITRMKDAILNTMELPVIALWKDFSLCFSNKAARGFMPGDVDQSSRPSNGIEFMNQFVCYDEHFTRRLTLEENPLVELTRTQRPFSGKRIGMIHPATGRRIVFDVSGEGLLDEKTGEFHAGLVWLRDVTEYTNLIAIQAEASERRFQTICDSMPQMLWTTTPDGFHDYFSQKWYDYTGLTEDTSFGTNWVNAFHPDDVPLATERWRHSLETGEMYVTEYRCRSRDGEWRWMLGRALPERDSKTDRILKWYGSCTDIHDAVTARMEAKNLQQQLSTVLSHALATLWVVDKDRNLRMIEGSFMQDLPPGWSRDSVLTAMKGKNFYEICQEWAQLGTPDIPPIVQPIEDILDGKTTMDSIEYPFNGKWYRTRFVAWQGALSVTGEGFQTTTDQVDGVIGISMDITELKSRQIDLQTREKENSMLQANEAAAKEASRLKSQFLANMSHEIRTPIAGVIGMAELLIDTTLTNEQRECAENIQRSANALLTVINDILDFSKVESGRLDIEEVQFSLSLVIRDVCKMLSFAAERKSIDFESDIQVGLDRDLIVMGDPGRLRQILTNVLTNSIKFTNHGSVRLAVMPREETNEKIAVQFVVEDTGIGIEDEVMKKLFQPFSQADSSTARRFGGTGLGLTISKNLVDLMHGEISLESTVGQGTTARFWIPFSKPQFENSPLVDIGALPERLQSEMSLSCSSSDFDRFNTGAQNALQTPEDERPRRDPSPRKSPFVHTPPPSSPRVGEDLDKILPEAERKKIHVLIVEDNAINQQIAVKTIEKLNFSVHAVWNGKEALEYLESAESANPTNPAPDIILMDVQMPIMDGYKTTRIIRTQDRYKNAQVPILAMTASAIQGDKEKCKEAGMDDYLAKPVKGKMLEKMLVKWVLETRKAKATDPPVKGTDLRRQLEEKRLENYPRHESGLTVPTTDTASSSTGTPKARPELPTPFTSVTRISPADLSAERTVLDRDLATSTNLPDTKQVSENDHNLRRALAEEQATSLRDAKLLAASTADPLSRSPEPDDTPLRTEIEGVGLGLGTGAPLTEENIGKLDSALRDASPLASPLGVGPFPPDLENRPTRFDGGKDIEGRSQSKSPHVRPKLSSSRNSPMGRWDSEGSLKTLKPGWDKNDDEKS